MQALSVFVSPWLFFRALLNHRDTENTEKKFSLRLWAKPLLLKKFLDDRDVVAIDAVVDSVALNRLEPGIFY